MVYPAGSFDINRFSPRNGRVIREDGSVVNEADGINDDGSQNVRTVGRKSITIKTHNAVSVPASGQSASEWIDCEGYEKIAFTIMNEGTYTSSANVQWSHDGVNMQGQEDTIPFNNSTARYRAAEVFVKAKYCRLNITNGDTSARTISAWAYLKA